MWYYDAMIWLVVVNPSESYVSIDIIIIIIGTSSPLLGQKITHNISNHLITLQTFDKMGGEEKKTKHENSPRLETWNIKWIPSGYLT
jgi:hypothetical protein